jgi:uncharacterized protein YjbI with pentapeptide repeats
MRCSVADKESGDNVGSEFLNLLVSRLGEQELAGAMEEFLARQSPKEMPKANLSGIKKPLALYRGTNLTEADLSHSEFLAADFTDANLTDANLKGVALPKANCSKSRLLRANMTEAHLVEAVFDSAFLRQADLTRADLRRASFRKANLVGAKLHHANLEGADLTGADLRLAKLNNASLRGAKLYDARLGKADLTGADLCELDLSRLDLSGSQLKGANLSKAILVETNLTGADLTGCLVYGVAAWNTALGGTTQAELIISGPGEPMVTVDHLEIAQFVYLLNNAAIRDVIDTIARKAVLILGRFTERKPVLDALRGEIRRLGYLPMVFDFERPTQRDFTETIMTLAGMSVFVIADITSPRSTPLELQATVPNYMIPFVPIIQRGEEPFSMFVDLQGKYDWVMDTLEYDTVDNLVRGLEKAVILPALERHRELVLKKGTKRSARSIKDYV